MTLRPLLPKRWFLGAVFLASVWFFTGGPFAAPIARAATPVFESGSTAIGDSDLVTVAKPSGTAAGDLLVAVVNFEKGSNVTVFTPPAGWTLIRRDDQGGNIGMATFYKIAGASEGATYSWTLNGAPKWAAGIARISGVNAALPINASNGSVLNTGNPAAPSVNTTVDGALVLAFYANKKNATYIPGAGTTERWDAPNVAGNQPSNMMATFSVAAAGASGSKTAAASDATGDWAAQQIALAGAIGAGAARTGTINVVKRVINDNGGTKTVSDFQLYVNETPVVSGESNFFPAPAGVYAVTETVDDGYAKSFSGDCDAAGRININPGDIRFCILTNDDIGAALPVPPVPPIIDIVKVPAPLSLPGGPGVVTYTYTLRNVGIVPVTDISLTVDSCDPIVLVSGDADGDSVLDVGEAWTYRCSTTLTETHTNTVVATGWANGLTATDIASATVVVGVPIVPPLIHLTLLPSPLTLPSGGGEITHTASVTNPGKIALSGVRVTDDTCAPMTLVSGDTDGDAMLDTSETWTYVCRTYQPETMTSTAAASGDANGLTARDYSIATVVVATPGEGKINVIKRVINDDGGIKTLADFKLFVDGRPVISGVSNSFPAPARATYGVTETADPGYVRTYSGDCGGNGRLTLRPGDRKICIVTNDDVAPPRIVPPAPAVPPLIDVLKVPSPLTLPGGPGEVAYAYTLRNLGTVPVSDITMVGDTCAPISFVSGDANGDGKLDVDETWAYTCSLTIEKTHVATVVATGWANGLTATDLASATVVVGSSIVPPLIHVTKVPSRWTLQEGGGEITYVSTVTNPGTAPLEDLVITDDECAPTQYFFGDEDGDALLDSGETWTYMCRTEIFKTTTNTVRVDGAANGLVARDYAIVTVVVAAGATLLLRIVGWSVIAVFVIGIALLLYGIRRRRMARPTIEKNP